LQTIRRICAYFGPYLAGMGLISTVLVAVSGCGPSSDEVVSTGSEVESVAEISYLCGPDGFLETQLFGALEVELDWAASDLKCEGMPRPDADGARLRFAGEADDGSQIAIIVGLPDLQRGSAGAELQSNVTVIEEGQGRFFSTTDVDVCWTDITRLEYVADSDATFTVSGSLYCVAPLAQINGDSDVLIRDLKFRGLLDWNAS
jgi:hypothetical protein